LMKLVDDQIKTQLLWNEAGDDVRNQANKQVEDHVWWQVRWRVMEHIDETS